MAATTWILTGLSPCAQMDVSALWELGPLGRCRRLPLGERALSEGQERGWLDPSPPALSPAPQGRAAGDTAPGKVTARGADFFSSSGAPLSRAFLILQINSIDVN